MILNLKGRQSQSMDPEDLLVQSPWDGGAMSAEEYLGGGGGDAAAGGSGENPLSPSLSSSSGVDITNPPDLLDYGRDTLIQSAAQPTSRNPTLAPLVQEPPALTYSDNQYATIGQLETAKIQAPVIANQPTIAGRVMPIQAEAVAPVTTMRVTQLFTVPAQKAPVPKSVVPVKKTAEKKSSKPAPKKKGK